MGFCVAVTLTLFFFGRRSVYTLNSFETDSLVALTKIDNERNLGIEISSDLKWNLQVKKAANKANSVLGMLK